MMTLFIIIAMYMAVGTLISRAVYGNQMNAIKAKPQSLAALEAREALKAIVHDGSCYQRKGGSYYNANRDCDCGQNRRWREARDELKDAPDVATPTNPYLLVAGWPFAGYHKFLTSSGGSKENRARAREIAAAQHDIYMAELREQESAALDRELERAGR